MHTGQGYVMYEILWDKFLDVLMQQSSNGMVFFGFFGFVGFFFSLVRFQSPYIIAPTLSVVSCNCLFSCTCTYSNFYYKLPMAEISYSLCHCDSISSVI